MFALTAALLMTASHPAVLPAEFRLAGQPHNVGAGATAQRAGSPYPLAPLPQVATDDGNNAGETDDGSDGTPAPAPAKPRFFTAYGFGRDVPLSFAMRQIVPARVRVTYGAGVDDRQPVTWKGGRPWNDVLRAAVAPLGLHLVMSHMAVTIAE